MSKIILASASPRRKELLEQVGLQFDVITSDIEESINNLKGTPYEIAKQLSFIKAHDVNAKLEIPDKSNSIVIAADTIVVINNEIMGKPKDSDDAYNMLYKLSAKEHEVITGVTIIDNSIKRTLTQHETTKVTFRNLSSRMINAYINSGEHRDKAGSYAIQGLGSILVDKIEGSYTNVVGLPLTLISKMLENVGFYIL